MNAKKEKEISDLRARLEMLQKHVCKNKKDHTAKVRIMRTQGNIRALMRHLGQTNVRRG